MMMDIDYTFAIQERFPTMPKTSMLAARIDPELKSSAEDVLARLGITAGGAITMFYKQIVLRQALPFPVTLHADPVPSLDRMTRADFDCELAIGDEALREGRARPAGEAIASIRGALRP